MRSSKTFLGISAVSFVMCTLFYYNSMKSETDELLNHIMSRSVHMKTDRPCPNTTEAEVLEKQERKRILFWTPVFRRPSLKDHYVGSDPKATEMIMCPHKCEFTTNHDKLCQSDAILFHGFDIQTKRVQVSKSKTVWIPDKIPPMRKSSQYWIFFYHESPAKTQEHFEAYDGLFNMTITYRRSSDFYQPYGRLINSTKQLDNDHLFEPQKILANKTDLVAWAVSNCNPASHRKKIVDELQKYIKVDVYGSCGTKKCPPIGVGDCYGILGKTYKFYLAFENSICEEYVTEKFFYALRANMVPVVYGGANYSHYAPVGSYIDVNEFASMKELAEYLLRLDENDDEYLAYFEWQKSLEVSMESRPKIYCALCEKLTLGLLPKSIVKKDLNQWWYGDKKSPTCTSSRPKNL